MEKTMKNQMETGVIQGFRKRATRYTKQRVASKSPDVLVSPACPTPKPSTQLSPTIYDEGVRCQVCASSGLKLKQSFEHIPEETSEHAQKTLGFQRLTDLLPSRTWDTWSLPKRPFRSFAPPFQGSSSCCNMWKEGGKSCLLVAEVSPGLH